LPHGALAANQAKPGLYLFALFAHCHRFSKTYYALQPHCPALFCLFSAEAYLLTGKQYSRSSQTSVFKVFKVFISF